MELQRIKRRCNRLNTRKPPENLTSGMAYSEVWVACGSCGATLAAARPSGLNQWARGNCVLKRSVAARFRHPVLNVLLEMKMNS